MKKNENSPSITSKEAKVCAAEFLAAAVSSLFPSAALIGGESNDLGFFYDFIFEQKIDHQMLLLIEQETLSLVRSNPPIKTLNMMRQNAFDYLKHHKLPFRAELLETVEENIVELIQIDHFVDLCPAPHLPNTEEISSLKLLTVEPSTIILPDSGTVQTTRISGVAFSNPQKLKKFLKGYESGKKREHQLLGKELNLFSQNEELGIGNWSWHPKGKALRDILLGMLIPELKKQKFERVATPRFLKPEVLKKANFAKFFTHLQKIAIDGQEFLLYPDTSIPHALLFSKISPTQDQLPVRYAEISEFFNSLKESQLCGMLRSRSYASDEQTIFCSPSQVMNELISSLHFINKTIRIFGFESHWHLRTKKSRFAGTEDQWKKSLQWLAEALQKCGIEAGLEESEELVFGPCVELRMVDAFGREWKGPSLGFDLALPERLGLHYHGGSGGLQTPIMIERSLFGSLERFVAILVEHYAGYFPLWLAPEQVRVLPVKEQNENYARKVADLLEEQGFRVSVDARRESIGEKVYTAERNKVPYSAIVGDSEEKNEQITVRRCQHSDNRTSIGVGQFIDQLRKQLVQNDSKNCG